MYCIVRHHRHGHVAAARKRSHQWCLTLTSNNTETTKKMTRPCFLWPIRRDLPSSYYTPRTIFKKERSITAYSWQGSVRISEVDFLWESVDWARKSFRCPYQAVSVKWQELYSFHPIPNPWRTSVEHISITLSHTFIYQNIYKNSCLNSKCQKLKKQKQKQKQDT